MFLAVRNAFNFCRVQVYLQRFKELEAQVNRREKQLIDKKEQLARLRELSHLTHQDHFYKFLASLTQKHFESEAVRKEKQKLKSLHDILNQVRSDGASRSDVAKRLAEQEKLNREKMFLIDIARFANKFHRVAHLGKFNSEVKLGLELSSKNLEHKLEKEGVEFLGQKGQKLNKQIHEKVDGEGEEINEILERGIRARGMLVAKAKVQVKPSV